MSLKYLFITLLLGCLFLHVIDASAQEQQVFIINHTQGDIKLAPKYTQCVGVTLVYNINPIKRGDNEIAKLKYIDDCSGLKVKGKTAHFVVWNLTINGKTFELYCGFDDSKWGCNSSYSNLGMNTNPERIYLEFK